MRTQIGVTAGTALIQSPLDAEVVFESGLGLSNNHAPFTFGTVSVSSGTLRMSAVAGPNPTPVALLRATTLDVAPGAAFVDEVGARIGTLNASGSATLSAVGPAQVGGAAGVTRLVVPAGGSVALQPNATWPGQSSHVVDDLLVDGALTWPAGMRILHTGAGSLRGGNLPPLTATGTACVASDATIQGDFAHTAGSLTVDRLVVSGDAVFEGAGLTGAGVRSMVVAGDVRMATTGAVLTPRTSPVEATGPATRSSHRRRDASRSQGRRRASTTSTRGAPAGSST
ncbi:MAG: hypothetical protein IPM13_18040 [Phycisphaerales bacterium]|nr:hypothetical protein [Phycisphaerales bacterium]